MRKSTYVFSPFDRTATEAEYENASIGSDFLHGRHARRDIRECFRNVPNTSRVLVLR